MLLEQVITYLQREIRAGRRNVGDLKLSNLLQLDRFEEDLNVSRVRLRSPPPHPTHCLLRRPNPYPLPNNNKAARKLSGIFDNLKRISAFFSRTELYLQPAYCPLPLITIFRTGDTELYQDDFPMNDRERLHSDADRKKSGLDDHKNRL